jgi:hypothetical protein
MNRQLLFACLALVISSAPVLADTKTYGKAQVSFTVPDAWSERQDGEAFIVMDAKQEAAVIFTSMPANDVKWASKAKARTINGLKAESLEGTGKYKGQLVDMTVLLVGSPTGRVLQVTAFVQSDKRIDHKDSISKVLGSIKAAKAKVQRQTIAEVQVSLELPTDWRAETKGKVHALHHPSGDASVVFTPLDAADLKAAAQVIDAKVGELYSDVKWAKKGTERKVNGLSAWLLEGTGKNNGELANLWVAVIKAPNGKLVLSVIRVNADMRVTLLPMIQKMFKSFGPPV